MTKIDNVMHQEMSRKQFLSIVGLAIITILGIPAILGIFGKEQLNDSYTSAGYGAGPYGR